MKEYNVLSVVMTGVNNDEVYSVTTDVEVNENEVFELVKEYGFSFDGYKQFLADYNACLYNLVNKVTAYFDSHNLPKYSLAYYEYAVNEYLAAQRLAERQLFQLKWAFFEAFERHAKDYLTADLMAVELAYNNRNADDFGAYFDQLKRDMVLFYGEKEAKKTRDYTPVIDCKYIGEMIQDIKDTFERGFSRDRAVDCEFWFAVENIRDKVHHDTTMAVIRGMYGEQKLTPHAERYEAVYDTDGTPLEEHRCCNNPY